MGRGFPSVFTCSTDKLPVDYKTKNIEDDAYPKQLHVYQHVIEKLYPASKNHIHLYLLSILDAEEKEIPAENDSSL